MAARYGRRPAGMKKMTSAAYFGQAEVILYMFIEDSHRRTLASLPFPPCGSVVKFALQIPPHQHPYRLMGIAVFIENAAIHHGHKDSVNF